MTGGWGPFSLASMNLRALLLGLVVLACVGTAYAYAEFSFINSNNGAAMTSNSNKLDCLRTVMMAVNPNISNAFTCSSDTCYQTGSSFVKGRIYSCFDIAGCTVGGQPCRRCKIDGPYSTWRSLNYSQGINGCTVCPQANYTGGSCNVDGFGNPLMNALWETGGSQNQVVKVFQ